MKETMMEESSGLLWTQPEWKEQAMAWIHAQLVCLGLQAMGSIEQPHIRPWSTVMHVPTDRGTLYFKAPLPAYSPQEVPLTAFLSRRQPGVSPTVLAADLERHWMLTADSGVTLRRVLQADGDIRHWHRALTLYTGLQRELSECLPDLLDLGIPDRRLEILPTQYAQLLTHTEVLGIDQPEGLTSAEYRRLCEFTPLFAALCDRLAAYGIPETLQHDDLHDNNILVREGNCMVFDWGDSCISHPFLSLLVILRSAAHTLALEPNAPALLQLRDLYLEPWTHEMPREDLREAFALAYRIGMICRALTWHRVLLALDRPLQAEYAESVSGWFQEFLSSES
jgi:hypothetical protein